MQPISHSPHTIFCYANHTHRHRHTHITHLGEVPRRVGVDALQEGQLVRDELQRQHADQSCEAVVGGDHDRVRVQPLRELRDARGCMDESIELNTVRCGLAAAMTMTMMTDGGW